MTALRDLPALWREEAGRDKRTMIMTGDMREMVLSKCADELEAALAAHAQAVSK